MASALVRASLPRDLTGVVIELTEHEAGPEGDALDVGLGMRPDLTGQGLGLDFVRAGLRFARDTYVPPAFRLTVATFNRRAIKVYERAGFEPVRAFGDRGTGWLLMRRG